MTDTPLSHRISVRLLDAPTAISRLSPTESTVYYLLVLSAIDRLDTQFNPDDIDIHDPETLRHRLTANTKPSYNHPAITDAELTSVTETDIDAALDTLIQYGIVTHPYDHHNYDYNLNTLPKDQFSVRWLLVTDQ